MTKVELLKFGEGLPMLIPSQAFSNKIYFKEGVETRRAAPKDSFYGEGIVQTTNIIKLNKVTIMVVKTIVVRKSPADRLAGSSPAIPTSLG